MEIIRMIKVLMILFIVVFSNSCMAQNNDQFMIKDKQIGDWKLGMSYSDIVNQYPAFNFILREGNDLEEGHKYRIASAWEASEESAIATFNLNDAYMVEAITVYDPRFKTTNGIGVGSTIANVIAAYSKHKIVDRGQPILVPLGSSIEFFLPATEMKDLSKAITGVRIGVE